AVDEDVAVSDELAGRGAADGEAQVGDDVIQPALEQGHEHVAGVAGASAGHFVIAAELALEDAVVPLDLLLLAQPDRVLARLAPAVLLLAGRAVAALD